MSLFPTQLVTLGLYVLTPPASCFESLSPTPWDVSSQVPECIMLSTGHTSELIHSLTGLLPRVPGEPPGLSKEHGLNEPGLVSVPISL
jgi:hypothetical protein